MNNREQALILFNLAHAGCKTAIRKIEAVLDARDEKLVAAARGMIITIDEEDIIETLAEEGYKYTSDMLSEARDALVEGVGK
jgi:hypothetical protein